MSRKILKFRKNSGDYKYGNNVMRKMIRRLMKEGKLAKAEKIFYSALDITVDRINKKYSTSYSPNEIFTAVITKVSPAVEVRTKRVGGATYRVPKAIMPQRAIYLLTKWLQDGALSKKGNSMIKRLADEMCDAYENKGYAVNKREILHKEANSAQINSHLIDRASPNPNPLQS